MTRLVNMFSSLRERPLSLACAPPVSNCMSEIPQPPTPKKEAITPLRESAAVEPADDTPDTERNYGETRLWLAARDPRSLFAYWEFRPEEHPDAFGEDGRARFFLRIFRDDGHAESSTGIEPGAGNAFLPVASPGTGYFAELGFYSGDIWCFLARSEAAHTPPETPAAPAPAVFATIPSLISLEKFRAALAHTALPGESLAMTAARIQSDAQRHGEWTPEHERLLAEILGADAANADATPANSLTLTQHIRQKLAAAAEASAPGTPLPAPQGGGDVFSASSSWPAGT